MEEKLPSNISLYEKDGDLVIQRKWSKSHGFLTLLFCSLFLFLGSYFLYLEYAEGQVIDLPGFLFILPFFVIFLVYWGLAHICNSTYIRVNPDTISINISPIKWLGNKVIQIDEVVQFYGREEVVRSGDNYVTYYHLCYRSRFRDEGKLLSRLESEEQVRFIEKKLEDILGIEDDHVFRYDC